MLVLRTFFVSTQGNPLWLAIGGFPWLSGFPFPHLANFKSRLHYVDALDIPDRCQSNVSRPSTPKRAGDLGLVVERGCRCFASKSVMGASCGGQSCVPPKSTYACTVAPL